MVNDDGQLKILRTTPAELVFKTPKKELCERALLQRPIDLSFEK